MTVAAGRLGLGHRDCQGRHYLDFRGRGSEIDAGPTMPVTSILNSVAAVAAAETETGRGARRPPAGGQRPLLRLLVGP